MDFYKANPPREFEDDFDKDGYSAFVTEWYSLYDKAISITDDIEASQANIDKLDKLFKAAVKAEVEKRLAGSAPKGNSSTTTAEITKENENLTFPYVFITGAVVMIIGMLVVLLFVGHKISSTFLCCCSGRLYPDLPVSARGFR